MIVSRPSRRQARPLCQGPDWSIELRDALELLGVVLMGGGFAVLVRWGS